CSQMVTIPPATGPILVCSSNKTVQCGTVRDFDSPALNTCCSNVGVLVIGTFTNGSPCGGGMTIMRTWQATDCCSNTAICSQTVTFPAPAGPLLTCASNKTVQCSNWSFDPPTINSCCSNVIVTITGTFTNGSLCSTGMIVTRTWQATNCCG